MQLLLLLLFPHLYPTKMCAQAIVHDKRETVLSLLPCKNNNYSSRYQACYLNRAGAHDQCLDLFKANCDLQKHTWAQKNENRHDFFNLLATKNGNVKIVQLYLVNAKRRIISREESSPNAMATHKLISQAIARTILLSCFQPLPKF